MEPISTVTSAWTIAKNAGELTKKLYELGKSIKDREIKQQLDEITDQLRELNLCDVYLIGLISLISQFYNYVTCTST